MTTLIAGLAIFFGMHSVPMIPRLKASLQSRFGEMPFKGIYSLISLTGFVLIIIGMGDAAVRPVWNPPPWTVAVPRLTIPIAFCLLVAAYVPNNFRRLIRHPMLMGVLLWALAHVCANGALAPMLLFGSFGLFAVLDMLSVNRRSAWSKPEQCPLYFDALVIIIGLGASFTVRQYHEVLFGVPA